MSVFKKGETWKVVDCEAMGITEGNFGVSNGYAWVVQEDSNYQEIGFISYGITVAFVEGGYVERVSEADKELTPRTLGCFQQVANIIGEAGAEIELQKVIDCEETEWADHAEDLMNSFDWDSSPHQYVFWSRIDDGYIPEEYQETAYLLSTEANAKHLEESMAELEGLTKSTPQKPSHYQVLPEYRVKDINKALLDKIQESDFEMSLNEAGWYQQSMQYFMRFYAKNGLEDLKKGVETMQIVIDSLESGKEEL